MNWWIILPLTLAIDLKAGSTSSSSWTVPEMSLEETTSAVFPEIYRGAGEETAIGKKEIDNGHWSEEVPGKSAIQGTAAGFKENFIEEDDYITGASVSTRTKEEDGAHEDEDDLKVVSEDYDDINSRMASTGHEKIKAQESSGRESKTDRRHAPFHNNNVHYPLDEAGNTFSEEVTSLSSTDSASSHVEEAEALAFSSDLSRSKEDDEEPYFDATMSPTIMAYLGKTATLTCIVHAAKTEKSVTWIRSRDLRILSAGRYTYVSDLRFEAMHSEQSSEWVLRLRSVQRRDQGKYECQITTKPIKTYSVYLNVVEPSVEILGAPDVFVNRASMINLTCIVRHAPNPPEEIVWFHGNQTISYTSSRGGVSVVEERGETTTSFLLLQNARPSDNGNFSCHPSGMKPTYIHMHVLLEGEHPAAMQTNSKEKIYSSQHSIFFALCLMIFQLYYIDSSITNQL